MKLLGLDHLVLRVVDLDMMLGFYVGVLGCSIERRQDEIGLVQLRAGQALIDLVPVDGKLGAWAAQRRAEKATTWITSACASSLSTPTRFAPTSRTMAWMRGLLRADTAPKAKGRPSTSATPRATSSS